MAPLRRWVSVVRDTVVFSQMPNRLPLGRNDPCPCKSGRKVKKCHEDFLVKPTPLPKPRFPDPDEFYSTLEAGLSAYPLLAARLPSGYPSRGRHRVDHSQARSFEQIRTELFAHNYNLPLALHLAASSVSLPTAKSFAQQLLNDVEGFLGEFGELPGAGGVVTPLWTSPWDRHDPCLWSVVAHCHLARRYAGKPGGRVVGFEVPTGTGNKTADIHIVSEEAEYLLEIEMWHSAKGATTAEIASESLRRAQVKADAKFSGPRDGPVGVVVEVCFAQDPQFRLIHENRDLFEPVDLTSPPRCIAQLMALMAVGGADGRPSAYSIADFMTPMLPLFQAEGA